jgi:Kef-type K+ transport system membrane component KefB
LVGHAAILRPPGPAVRQPRVRRSRLGELTAGIALGLLVAYAGVPFLGGLDLHHDETFSALIDLAIFFLMLLAGLELRPGELREASVSAIAIALSGFAVPLVSGIGLGWWLLPDSDAKLAQALLLGTALAVTAVPIAVGVLMEVGGLKSPVGRAIVSAAVVDDILSLGLLALLTGLMERGALPDLYQFARLVGGILLFS